MSRWNLAWLLGIVAATLVGLSISHSAPSRENNLQKKHENLKLLVDVLEEVQHKYVKDLDQDKMRELVENMINSGLERLDPHSSFINAEEFRQFQKQSKGRFGGIGIRIGVDRAGQILVESPMVGTPAYEAGVQAGDIIVKVDGKSTESLSLKKVVEMIQGEPGDKLTLTVLHEGAKKPVDLDITRAEIMVDSVLGDTPLENKEQKWEFMIDKVNRIAYIRLVAFTETTVEELTKVVENLQAQNMRGLVIDLRNNPGGLLKAAVEVSSMFLPEGERIVSTKGRNQREEVYDARVPKKLPPGTTYPIAILLNRYSASASEIVAAALQDHLRAVIIGERSYGKGSVQNIISMENGTSALKLTTASYWRPSGKNIHRFPDAKDEDEWGVRPDKNYEVKLPDEERLEYYKWRRDRDIVRRAGAKPPAPGESEQPRPKDVPVPDGDAKSDGDAKKNGEAKKKEPFQDRVLERALEYIRGELKKGQAAVPPAGERPQSAIRPVLAIPANIAAAMDVPVRRELVYFGPFNRQWVYA